MSTKIQREAILVLEPFKIIWEKKIQREATVYNKGENTISNLVTKYLFI